MEREPITFDRFIRGVIVLLIAGLAIYLINYLSGVLLPFFVALGLAYLIYPMVLFFQRKCKLRNRTLSIIVTLLLLIVIISGLCAIIVPSIISQTMRLKDLVLNSINRVGENKSIPALIEDFVMPYIADINWIEEIQNGKLIDVVKAVVPGIGGILNRTFSFLGGLLSVCVSLLYLFFILLDYEQIAHGWQRLFPVQSRGTLRSVTGRVRENMGNYFRGQSLIALCVGILFAIGFSIIDFPMAIGFGLFVGVLNLVPYLQTISFPVAFILSLLKAYDTGGSFWLIFLSALVVYVVVQAIQDMVLTPRIMGQAMGLNPAIILLSLSVWGALLGFIGMIIALPLTSLLLAYANQLLDERDAKAKEVGEKLSEKGEGES